MLSCLAGLAGLVALPALPALPVAGPFWEMRCGLLCVGVPHPLPEKSNASNPAGRKVVSDRPELCVKYEYDAPAWGGGELSVIVVPLRACKRWGGTAWLVAGVVEGRAGKGCSGEVGMSAISELGPLMQHCSSRYQPPLSSGAAGRQSTPPLGSLQHTSDAASHCKPCYHSLPLLPPGRVSLTARHLRVPTYGCLCVTGRTR